MIGKMLEISQDNRYLTLKRGSMCITDSKTKQNVATIAIDDIDGLILSGHGLWHSTNLLAKLAFDGVVVVLTNSSYLPVGVLVGISNNCYQGQRMIAQHDATNSTNNKIWQDIIQTKLEMQACLLEYYQSSKANFIKVYAKQVKIGDTSNMEAHGAKVYWQGWGEIIKDFSRDKNSTDTINIALNYGYTILRTAVAKSILATGLHTGWGIHHCHPNNTMPLADDMMEPFRILVDAKVHSLIQKEILNTSTSLNPTIKKALVDVVYTDIVTGQHTKPLINYLQDLAYSLVKIYLQEGKSLNLPIPKKINWQHFEYNC